MNIVSELLSDIKIKSAIAADRLHFLSKLEVFESIDSTNSYLLRAAKESASGWAVLSETQTAGRGRLDRKWFSPYASNIYCSLWWIFPNMQMDLSALSLAVGVMVVNALKKYGIQADLQLKWPNDVLFSGRKLAGILLESVKCENRIGVVIGIGLNLFLPREDQSVSPDWIDLYEITSQPIQRNLLAGILLDELLDKLFLFQTKGAAVFLEQWRRYDFLFGKKIMVQQPQGNFIGIAQGVREDGALCVLDENNVMRFLQYGEVSIKI